MQLGDNLVSAVSMGPPKSGVRELDFASLTPADVRTAYALEILLQRVLLPRKQDHSHHLKFILPQAADLAASRSPDHISELTPTPDVTDERSDASEDPSDTVIDALCILEDDDDPPSGGSTYIFSLHNDHAPHEEYFGWQVGTGAFEEDKENGLVDLLLPPSAEPSSATIQLGKRHCYFKFDKEGRFCLHARHKGVLVNGRAIRQNGMYLLGNRDYVSIGPHRFIFEFKVLDEGLFQVEKRAYMTRVQGNTAAHELVSATPSANDIEIHGWRLHGIAGASAQSTIFAGSNKRTGQTVAVKRLRVEAYKSSAHDEIELYDSIRSTTRDNRYAKFLMRKTSLLSDDRAAPNEVYMLWTPLALGDFTRFGVSGRWRSLSVSVKMRLLVQCILGLSALHDAGWIHRDIKPANLGVVTLNDRPRAVVMDLGQAVRQVPGGYKCGVGGCGTFGYTAPEIESSGFSEHGYGKEVDIWSMGAVAYYVLMGRLPWSEWDYTFRWGQANENAEKFEKVFKYLSGMPTGSIPKLVGWMLAENPALRPTIPAILEDDAVAKIYKGLESELDSDVSAGMKHARDT